MLLSAPPKKSFFFFSTKSKSQILLQSKQWLSVAMTLKEGYATSIFLPLLENQIFQVCNGRQLLPFFRLWKWKVRITYTEIRATKLEHLSFCLTAVMYLCACSCVMEFTFFSEIILLVPDYSYGGTDGLAEYTHKI